MSIEQKVPKFSERMVQFDLSSTISTNNKRLGTKEPKNSKHSHGANTIEMDDATVDDGSAFQGHKARFTPSKPRLSAASRKGRKIESHSESICTSSMWKYTNWIKKRYENLRVNVYISADGIYPRRACWEDYANRSGADGESTAPILDKIQADVVTGIWTCCKKKQPDAAGCCMADSHLIEIAYNRCSICSSIYVQPDLGKKKQGIYERRMQATACCFHPGSFRFLSLGVGHWTCCGGDMSSSGCRKGPHRQFNLSDIQGCASLSQKKEEESLETKINEHPACLRCMKQTKNQILAPDKDMPVLSRDCRWHTGRYIASSVRTRSLPPSAPDAVLVTVDLQEVRVQFWISETVGTDGCTNRFVPEHTSILGQYYFSSSQYTFRFSPLRVDTTFF